MRLAVTILVVLMFLAGCSESPAAPDDPDDVFDDKELESDAETGVIRGIVVNDAFETVQGAVVSFAVSGETLTETTDVEGRFGFSQVEPGLYNLNVDAELHTAVQFQATVIAGQDKPPIITVQIVRLYPGDPYVVPIKQAGFFQCSQANFPGYTYSSSPCHAQGAVDLDDYGVELDQNRDFHADVGAGWQTQVFEMTWESTAQGTSDRMGMSVSTYKPERNTNHWFASVASSNPMRFQLDVGVAHGTAQEGSGPDGPIPAEGLIDMSYYISVRAPDGAVCAIWCVPPGLAIDQSFTTYLHQFYYAPAPEGWAILNGDEEPF